MNCIHQLSGHDLDPCTPYMVSVGGISYPSIMHAVSAERVSDREIKRAISEAESYRAAMNAMYHGKPRQLTILDAKVMYELMAEKCEDPYYEDVLIGTDLEFIVYKARARDRFWGVHRGDGDNVVGYILSMIRRNLRKTYVDRRGIPVGIAIRHIKEQIW